MLVSSKKIEKMLRDRDRLERMAKIEYQEAKDLLALEIWNSLLNCSLLISI